MKIDKEFKNLIPPLTTEEYAQLEQNCIDYGIRDSLIITALPGENDTVLIDGHNRFEIAQKNNLAYNVKRLDFPDREAVKEWIIKNQLGRRNIPTYVRAELALKLKPVIQEQAKENQKLGGKGSQKSVDHKTDTQKELAKAAGVSHDTIHKVEKIQLKAPEEVKQALRRGEMSINQVYGWIAKEETPSKRQQEAQKVKEAEKRHKDFEEKKADGVIDLADAKQDKEDEKIIFEDFSRDFVNMVQKIRSFGAMVNIGSFEEAVRMADKYELREMSERLSDCYRAIFKMQRVVEEVIDEE